MHHHHQSGFADRYKSQNYQPSSSNNGGQGYRQPYHKAHSSVGAVGHWIHLLNVAAPLVIGEVVKDADKKWRFLRLASVGGAILSEVAWTMKVAHDRHKEEETREALEQCQQGNCR